jgi:predicted Fe-S protein YdhL (DUF1289 family)
VKITVTIHSPCIAVCQLDAAGAYCLGCKRTIAEIARWSGMSDAQRREVLARLKATRKKGAPNEK